ncbi:MAG: ATP synthase F1 subunit gamma [Actinobacteria bacterium]|nr:ATP synthase F1 subunit gamma [Actinomycetota bacterium]
MEKSRDIRNRIKSVTGTRKITKAMEMIASSKIRKAQSRIFEARAFIENIEEVITDIACSPGLVSDPLLAPHKDEKIVLVVGLTADRGLCGGYNANVIRLIENNIKDLKSQGFEVKLDVIGTRGRNYFRYTGFPVSKIYENLSDYPKFLDAREISKDIISRYISGEVDKVLICYTRFKNAAEQIPSTRQILPIPIGEKIIRGEIKEIAPGKIQVGDRLCLINSEFMFDPSPREVLGSLLPQYIYTAIYGVLLEATASETGARMTAMKSASDNAEEMIKELVKLYHRARQQQITMEITEIVSGAQALSIAD